MQIPSHLLTKGIFTPGLNREQILFNLAVEPAPRTDLFAVSVEEESGSHVSHDSALSKAEPETYGIGTQAMARKPNSDDAH